MRSRRWSVHQATARSRCLRRTKRAEPSTAHCPLDRGSRLLLAVTVERAEPDARAARAMLAGATLVALMECAQVLVFSAASFDGLLERASFLLLELLLALPVGA